MTDSPKCFCLVGFCACELSLYLEAKQLSRRQGKWMCPGRGGGLLTLLPSLLMAPEPIEGYVSGQEDLWTEALKQGSVRPTLELQG